MFGIVSVPSTNVRVAPAPQWMEVDRLNFGKLKNCSAN